MSSPVVLDTSAIVALLDEEPGADLVRSVIFNAAISAVTLAEAYSILSKRGQDGIAALSEIRFAIEHVIPFTEDQAETAGALRGPTKHAGLSLGDRACIALAIALGVELYTADRIWATLNLPCTIKLIR
ncbi:type II toxin-antitoxin system VapC family toxin [Granulicella sp. 5B5]|uniref:type II toxin-antitoxin system VapC family toxin n=1 Tax=Granulicella sp. 5B5 TaxID=1617967 RepID=UPI0015F3F69D|nr:type II toxin-antitoxin system VapC family toxin [Granulicella sp. 5B5]